MVSTNFSPEVAKTLHELGAHDILQMEQYMDFVRCRYFRKSLLCRSSVKLNRTLTPAVVRDLLLSSDAAPVPAKPGAPAEVETFKTSSGYSVNCRSPITKAALRELHAQWPMPVAFKDLIAHSKADEAGAEFLAGEMLTCMAAGVVEWRLTPVLFTTKIGKMPATTALARLEAQRGYKITNLRGESIVLDELHRQTVRQLDGKRDLAQVADALLASLQKGDLMLQRDSDKSTVTESAEMRKLLGPALDKVLANLAKKALLARADA